VEQPRAPERDDAFDMGLRDDFRDLSILETSNNTRETAKNTAKTAESSAQAVKLLEEARALLEREQLVVAEEAEFRYATDPIYRQWIDEKRAAEMEAERAGAEARRKAKAVTQARFDRQRQEARRKEIENRRAQAQVMFFVILPFILVVVGLVHLAWGAERIVARLRRVQLQHLLLEPQIRTTWAKFGSPNRFADSFAKPGIASDGSLLSKSVG
jgi:cation transport ATPase